MIRTSLVIAMAVSKLGCSVLGLKCSSANCHSGASIDILLSDGVSLVGATLTVCRNDQCSEGGYADDYSEATFAGDLPREALKVWRANDGIRIDLNVAADGVEDGDRYAVTLRAADGTLVVNEEWTAQYTEQHPNGENCDPVCERVQFETQGL